LKIYYSRSFVFIRGLINFGGPEFVSQKTPFLRLARLANHFGFESQNQRNQLKGQRFPMMTLRFVNRVDADTKTNIETQTDTPTRKHPSTTPWVWAWK